MKTTLISTLILAPALLVGCTQTQSQDKVMDRFIDDLMSRMTVEEKIGQLNLPATGEIVTGQAKSSVGAERIKAGEIGGLFNLKGADKIREVQRIAVEESRLGIPLLFGMDVIHGYETVFPIPLGLSCTWDMAAVEESAHIAAVEAGSDGICWTFSPMLDVSRDPRWGRVSEGNGEDPYLASRIAEAMVYGYQGRPGKQYETNEQIMACVKHFALYGAPEAGRDYNTVDMSLQRMFNEYMSPYKAAFDAGAGSAMVSFNEINGTPATANKWLLTDVLRDQWGFDGFVVTDYTGILELVDHGIGSFEEVSKRALNAGVDMDMVSEGLFTYIKKGLEDGSVSQKTLDTACRRILEAKYKLGLFEDPYRYCKEGEAEAKVYCAEHRAAARRIAAESFVLLKNEKGLLPLDKKGTVALVGPLANTAANMPGTWSVAAQHNRTVTLLDGMRETLAGKVNVLYAKGSNLCSDPELEARSTMFGRELGRDSRSDAQLLSEALAVARRSDVVIAALGESSEMSGESSSRSDISIPDVQKRLLDALLATGKPVVLLLFNGRAMTIQEEAAKVPAILDVWFGGTETAYAVTDVLFGDVNPSGKLSCSFPKNVGQIPIYYAHKNTGRPLADNGWFTKFRSNYLDVDNDPLYPFGYGLSYTSFSYSPVTLSADRMDQNGSIKASVTVTNTGSVAGKEVIQMYIRDLVGSSTRPVRELKGFEKILLQPGESRTVEFTVDVEMLKFYDADMQYVAEPGTFRVFIGPDSTTDNAAEFELI